MLSAIPADAIGPVLWNALGYQYEAASMLGALAACGSVRLWITLNERERSGLVIAIDLTVSVISLLFTAGWVMTQRPQPFYALLGGAGFGALGVGIVAVALAWIKRVGFGTPPEVPAASPPSDNRNAPEA
ncbi:hypothetical protein [Sphingomonas crusticola]|uniref:hypothetical protein n=1 Tax=Sphingomonas crusticola TaxID=1697973 RepID=UPI000E25C55B|nr:hypothetical protein [Sphingomonas crusticola]